MAHPAGACGRRERAGSQLAWHWRLHGCGAQYTILFFSGRLAPELYSSCALSTSTRGPSGTFFTRRRSAAIFDRLVQTLRVEYWRNWRRAVQTLQVSSLSSLAGIAGAPVSDATPSFLTLCTRIVRSHFLHCWSKQKPTGQRKWPKARKFRGKKRGRTRRGTRSGAWSDNRQKNGSRRRRIKPSKVRLPVAIVPAEWLTLLQPQTRRTTGRTAQVVLQHHLHRLRRRRATPRNL